MSDGKKSAFKYDYLGSDPKAIQRSVSNHLVYTIGGMRGLLSRPVVDERIYQRIMDGNHLTVSGMAKEVCPTQFSLRWPDSRSRHPKGDRVQAAVSET
ncbi:hypothetical protein [endosymbiont of Lamellibrachia barhami]|uniref:hypothetical protein n=1 Tax=endosymbiont of Lamellibrachia barhami TaxID=205975 RepID=UPI0015A7EFCA|nr:hypothetical protein [endosymbiont of Lamellibrachia barhami]